MTSGSLTRRTAVGIGALTAASYRRVLGANDRVQVGFVGYGLIGAQHVFDFRNQPDVDLAAMCDAYQPRLEQGVAACARDGRANPKAYSDFRKLIDDKDLQAVVVCTPDHWHALMTIMACSAGKDVYVEKPLHVFIREGEWMIRTARRHDRVVQCGTQQRSGLHYQHARELIQGGAIGTVMSTRASSWRNIMPGFGAPPDSAPPSDFDYNMWLGPAPLRPYNPKRGIYHFRWFWDYSGGQMTNLGAHEIDIMQWYLDAPAPKAVSSSGGRLVLQRGEDNGETPDTQDALFEYPKFTAVFAYREASQGPRGEGRLEFYGTKGVMAIDRSGFEIFPDPKRDPANSIPVFKGQPTGGPTRGSATAEFWTQPKKEAGSSDEQFRLHVRNFLDCVKSRQRPVSDVEAGHQVTTTCHLANISLRLGRKITWEAEHRTISGDPEAEAMLERPYRAPWDAVLKGCLA